MAPRSDLDPLRAFVTALAPIPDEEWEWVSTRIETQTVSAKSVLLHQGEPADRIYFVLRGLLKTYFTDESGDHATKGFAWEGRLAAPYVSLLTGSPSNFGISAIEQSVVHVIPGAILPQLYSRHPTWQEFGRKIAEGLFIERERREYQMLLMDAEARYEAYLRNFSEISERLPQYEIASYLGITPVALSQIRSRRVKAR